MRATNIKNLFNVSLLILVIMYLSVPAWATVEITTALDYDTYGGFIISFDAVSEPNLVRAFALDIRLDNNAKITNVILLSSDYIIHPGTIQIDATGEIINYGSPVAPQSDLPGDTLPGVGGNGVTIVLASLYAPVGPSSPNAPAPYGPLVSVTVDRSCCLTITPNITRAGPTGVVMESPDEVVTVNMTGACVYDPCSCLSIIHPSYDVWRDWGSPVCWCYRKQCRGDINGSSFLGKPVSLADLTTFKAAFNQIDSVVASITNGICADLNHAAFLGKRVTLADLNIFKTYFNKPDADVPCCDADQDCVLDAYDIYNYWTN